MYYKYPRTPHLPWSLGSTSDDKMLRSVDHFGGREVVVSHKLDGENTTMYRDRIHARSLDSRRHPSRSFVKTEHSRIKADIPVGMRICGENVYAKHSIHYTALTAYFYVYAIFDTRNVCLGWDDTVEFSQLLGLETVPVIYRGPWDESRVKACLTGPVFGGEQEGYVVRTAGEYRFEDFADNVAKYVRPNHVQTSSHWMQEAVVPNILTLQHKTAVV